MVVGASRSLRSQHVDELALFAPFLFTHCIRIRILSLGMPGEVKVSKEPGRDWMTDDLYSVFILLITRPGDDLLIMSLP
jgi:hypothetical protein